MTIAREKVAVHIRWMIRRDLPEVLAIENQVFEYPWNERDFRMVLNQNSFAFVAEVGNKIVGFDVLEFHRRKIHLISLGVHPDHQRQSVGHQLTRRALAKLSPGKRTHLVTDVRETNLAAQLFFRSQGFGAVGILRGYYEDSGEDAYRLVRWLEQGEEITW